MLLRRHILTLLLLMACMMQMSAQEFVNLTADEVRIDSDLPRYSCSFPLGEHYADSVYTVSILYPDFLEMTQDDILRYHAITTDTLPTLPEVSANVVVERKKGVLEVSLTPLVYRDGKYQFLVSFLLQVEGHALPGMMRAARAMAAQADRYVDNSVLATGKWAKIRVPSSGIYQLTDALIKQAGFTDLSKVRLYGYGGALQNERLVASELIATDDLKEVPTYVQGGRKLFYAQGPVSWSSPAIMKRTRNPYSDYGYYFITQDDTEPLTTDSATLVAPWPTPADYHALHEVDNFAWFQGGRNLFENTPVSVGSTQTYLLANPSSDTSGKISVAISAGTTSAVEIILNGKTLGRMSINIGDKDYDKGAENILTYEVDGLTTVDTIVIRPMSGGPVRLDYIDIYTATPRALPSLSGTLIPTPEYVHNITNQNLHAHTATDMVIIIPTSQSLRTQAQRIADMHTERDSLRVRIIPADELYNEFSSGTPDANAYRRYMKMLYDRAATEADLPKYLLLFGDCFWDNRMVTSDCRNYSPDDFLLCFESENSFSEIHCYVDDGFFALLDDGEGTNPQSSDKLDIAVGRFPVQNEDDAKTMTDKTVRYASNIDAGAWQNIIMVMGDDGNGNSHLTDANNAARMINTLYPGFHVNKVMWDAYTRETSATGNSYPDATKAIKQQQASGALIMDYSGHGSEISVSHERVLSIQDFQEFTNTHLPLWITASCDIMPFDASSTNIGEQAVLNKKGGAVAFFGTTRTVYQYRNAFINQAYLKHVLSVNNGRRTTIGEAQRLAKNELISTGQDLTSNKLQFSLLGDPALALNYPTMQVVIDSVNGTAVDSQADILVKAGAVVRVQGHVQNHEQVTDTAFDGQMTATIRDSEELIVCKGQADDTKAIFSYYDRQNVLFNGSDSVRHGTFDFTFAVPMDINYSDGKGLMNIYAVNNDHSKEAHGSYDDFTVGGTATTENDSIGPSIYCYLNSPSFANGGEVNSTPYFVAQITDKDGINAAGTGIGHDLELIIDDEMSRTYILNDHFTYDFGSYVSGSTYYSIPELSEGRHRLRFRAWDILNNSTTAELSFQVVNGLKPTLRSISCTNNPATTSTTFIITHDRMGSPIDVELDIYDMSGRQLWKHTENSVSTDSAITIDWDLTIDGGQRLQTGVYLYRVRIGCDGSAMVSKAKKIIIM